MKDKLKNDTSWESIVNLKKDAKIRFGQVLFKLVFCFILLISYSLLRKFGMFDAIRVKGINPSQTCITDSSHELFSNMLLAVHEYPKVRTGLQLVSSFMIDSVFIYLAFNW